jgi:hypothetical protein
MPDVFIFSLLMFLADNLISYVSPTCLADNPAGICLGDAEELADLLVAQSAFGGQFAHRNHIGGRQLLRCPAFARLIPVIVEIGSKE